MKHIYALCLLLATALPVAAAPDDLPAPDAPAELNLYIMLWPEGEEDDPTSAQVMEMGDDGIRIFTSATPEDEDKVVPLDPAQIALIGAAVKAVAGDISLQQGAPHTGHQVQVEWSISNLNSFSRGSTLYPLDALPPEVLAVQDKIFGMRLTP
ncbi:hypothetical protein ACEN2J_10090 [Pseudorhodobacter sp. W20_MBD10_FR17]|uniref:hypothetical protein n=1 Tax=Pseudorhodobacter sp. W20_MBD10_FR17 TaxID=3240266 RepID=UPI003F98DAD3